MVNSLALIFAIAISIAHYYAETLHLHKQRDKIRSLAAGVLMAFLILDLFPRLFLNVSLVNNSLFLFILIGFSLLHLVEKYIYQHASKNKKLKELREVHAVIFFIYFTFIGILIVNITNQSPIGGLLFFIPLLFHTTIGTISMKEIHSTMKENKLIRLSLSVSPLIGLLIATYFFIPPIINHSLLALISGVLLYIITREVIPKENKGDPIDFLLGVSIYSIVIVFTWII